MSRPIERNVFTPPAWEPASFMPQVSESFTSQPPPAAEPQVSESFTSHPPSQPVQPQPKGDVGDFLMGQRPVRGLWAKRLAAAAIIIGMFAIVAYMIWWQIPEVKTQNTCYDWYVNKHPEQIGLLLMAQQANKFFNHSSDFNNSLMLPLQVP